MIQFRKILAILIAYAMISTPIHGVSAATSKQGHPDRLLWGDVHLHTNLSWDAYYMGNQTATPETAYRFAKGLPVVHPFHRARVRITKPLDFLAVTDHSEFLGLPSSLLIDKDKRMTSTRLGKHLASIYERGGPGAEALVSMILAFQAGSAAQAEGEGGAAAEFPPPPPQVTQEYMDWLQANPEVWGEFFNRDVMRNSWEQLIEAAERHNQPGKFTTLIGWEYSPQAKGDGLDAPRRH